MYVSMYMNVSMYMYVARVRSVGLMVSEYSSRLPAEQP